MTGEEVFMIRGVLEVLASLPTLEGAGVHLRRAFGYAQAPRFDPFLLLDDFRSTDPKKYLAGFPWHPHRGIETITTMLEGSVEHGDSLGNRGTIHPGDVQWMTAGSGIIHQEMPKPDPRGRMGGFQLWANLPASHKMIDPRYRDVLSDRIPIVETDSGARVRVVCGEVGGASGPVRDVVTEPEYLDVELASGTTFEHGIPRGATALAYLFEGSARFDPESEGAVVSEHLIAFVDGDSVRVRAEAGGARFLLLSGRPIGEPVAWRGPIVMNTEEELRLAFSEYRDGTFLRHQRP
jgi:redox-sensitive bicupin YhaK (pirin superfamily)